MSFARAFARSSIAAVVAAARTDAPCTSSAASGFRIIDAATKRACTTPAPAFSRAYAATDERAGSAGRMIDRYGTAQGPMAGLLRVLRDAPGLTSKELFERATAADVQTRSMRHMKGLLSKMKAIDRVKTTPPMQGEGKRRGRGNFTYDITEVGAKYVERLDGAARAPKPL